VDQGILKNNSKKFFKKKI